MAPLVDSPNMRKIFAASRPKLTDTMQRMLSTRSAGPEVLVREYVEAQASPDVRATVMRLLKGHKWLYVSFAEFLDRLRALTHRLLDVVESSRVACFVVDELHKSSFWVLALALLLADERVQELYKQRRVFMALDEDETGGGLYPAFHQLPSDACLVFMDDAAYSGEQLSYFMHSSVRQFRDVHGRMPRQVVVAVPYMATASLDLFRIRDYDGVRILHEVTFKSLLHRRAVTTVLGLDLFVESKRLLFTEFRSFVFDILGVLPTNTLVFFQHKIADSLSIPHRWLKLGPGVPRVCRVAWRVKPDRVAELARLIRGELRRARSLDSRPEYMQLPGQIYLDCSRRVIELMQSSRFRAAFMDRVALPEQTVRFTPLLPPEYCDTKYQQSMRVLVRRRAPESWSGSEIPDCHRPPYKRDSLKRRIAFSLRP
jgi:hypothetical protein